MSHKLKKMKIFLVLSCILSALHAQEIPAFKVEPIPAYNELIYNESGWTGADGSFSVAISDSVILWLYSDTWIGDIANGKHENATIVNNSVGIQIGKNASQAKIDFFWKRKPDWSHAAFVTPRDSIGYFWLYDGIMLSDKLYFAMMQIVSRRGSGVFGFELIGTWLAEVDNPHNPPLNWHIKQSKILFGKYSRNGNIFFGASFLKEDDFVYIYGCHEDWSKGRSGRSMIVARVEANELTDFDSWQFYANDRWVSDFTKSEMLFNGIATEYSVTYQSGIDKYVTVFTQNGMSDSIMVRFSNSPVGPWSKPALVYSCPEENWHPTYFCYAAKAHPELSISQDELIVTYVCNSLDFWQLAKDARIYWPRFLRMTFPSE